MPNLRSEDTETPGRGTPEGFDGHVSTGYDCLSCGAHVKPRFVKPHQEWHEQVDRLIKRVLGG